MIHHLELSIRGALRRTDRELKQFGFTREDGSKLSGAQIRELLLDHLEQGHKVLPMSKDCEGFDYVNGCPGHEEGRQP